LKEKIMGKAKGKYGSIFIGNPANVRRDGYLNSTDGPEPGGTIDYLPEYECTGGSSDPADRACPHVLAEKDGLGRPTTGGGWDGRLLHVNMPSFRDPLCPRTLFNLFTKSARPADLRVRVLQQNVPEEDDDCLEKYCAMMAIHRAGGGGARTATR
jgi:hypothetical protein